MIGSSERTLAHTRQITCEAYRRGDGDWEIEASVRDLKAEVVPFRSRPPVVPGQPMHDMRLVFLIDAAGTIRDVKAAMQAAPWPSCREATRAYEKLIGVTIGPGLRARVRERVGGVLGCTHLTDLITQVGNAYMQAAWPARVAAQIAIDPDPRRWPDQQALSFVGACHAWTLDGEAVRTEYPELLSR